MGSNLSYYKWFGKIVSILIDTFFILAVLSSLFVLTSFVSSSLRYLLFGSVFLVYILIIHFFKEKIQILIRNLIEKLRSLSMRQMFIIIVSVSLITKIIYSFLFSFDSTQSGDIGIYNEIAEQIIATGELRSSAISHLFGMAAHMALMKAIGMPLHIGMYIAILLGTLFNFFSVSKIIGKEKSFLAAMVFVLMPSTSLLSFCITHEVLVYLYLSAFMCMVTVFLRETEQGKEYLFAFLMILSIILTCMVNPAGYVIYVILVLLILLTNVSKNKKIILAAVLILSIGGSKGIDKLIDVDEHHTTLNTYSILIHGSYIGSMGEQQDGLPHLKMREYLTAHNLEFNDENFEIAARAVLLDQYKYLLTHPADCLSESGISSGLFICTQKRIYILFTVEHVEILDMLSHADKLNRDTKLRPDGNSDTSLCSSIHLRQDNSGDIRNGCKLFNLLQSILSCGGINYYQSFKMRPGVFIIKNIVDLVKLVHEILLVM